MLTPNTGGYAVARTKSKRPTRQFQAGCIFGAVWTESRKTGNGEAISFSIQIEKRYRDERTGTWHSTSYLRPEDLPKLSLVANQIFKSVFYRGRALTETEPSVQQRKTSKTDAR
jgi:hypothetical protein